MYKRQGSPFGKVFFCSSGTEANEAAIKLARKYARVKHGAGRHEIVTAQRSFHGRTLGSLTATGQTKYHKDFGPLLSGFKYVPFNDVAAMEQAVTTETAAVLLSLIHICPCDYGAREVRVYRDVYKRQAPLPEKLFC